MYWKEGYKKWIIVGVVAFLSNLSFAQVAGGELQKLFDYFVQEDFEKCYIKAEKMSKDDKTKGLSEPYLYMSMCMIKFSEDEELTEAYPKPIKTALKMAVKFKKKDDKRKAKEKTYLQDDNQDYLDEMKELALREAKGFFVQDLFRKASYFYKIAVALDVNDPVLHMMRGVCMLNEKNLTEGQKEVDLAIEKYKEFQKDGYEVNPRTEQGLIDGFKYYAKYLMDQNKKRDALKILDLGLEVHPESDKLKKLYKSYSN